MKILCLLLLASAAPLAAASDAPADATLPDQPIAPAIAVDSAPPKDERSHEWLKRDPDRYSTVMVASGLSAHRPMFVLPVTWSPDYHGRHTEVEFQISLKQRVLDSNLYFGYTQKSFWQMYNKHESSPFRESNYNPEVFYRFTPDPVRYNHFGADFGLEHESNGRDVPYSRSWNRLYFAPFQAKGKYLAYLKVWYRLPEHSKTSPSDSGGDDNPDIARYYGYTELHLQREFGGGQQVWAMLRGNPGTGKGAISLNYSIPNSSHSMIWCLNMWHGYGESLIDYNHSITRVGLGLMFAR
ncbi:MAG TPA: phospholipase A [Nevskiaceae bacterium]|nr:phospholipase A [Nevskiaceae bacterium]